MKDITIIIPTYNRPEMLERSLLSIKTQNKEIIEVVVCDDGSSNNNIKKNIEITKKLKKELGIEIKYLKNQRIKGVSGARNFAIENSNGKWLFFLDDDDEFTENYIDYVINYLKQNGNIDLLWSNVIISRFQNNKVIRVKKYFTPSSEEELYKDFISIGLGYGVVIKKEIFIECGLFNEAMRVAEDTDLFFRMIRHKKNIVNLPFFGMILHEHLFEKLSKTYDYHAKNHIFKKLFRQNFTSIRNNNILYIAFSSWIVSVYKQAGMKREAIFFCFEFLFRKIYSKQVFSQFLREISNLIGDYKLVSQN